MFAEDTAYLVSYDNINEPLPYVNCKTQKIARWFRSKRIAVNISKTQLFLFKKMSNMLVHQGPVPLFKSIKKIHNFSFTKTLFKFFLYLC
jgi:hypothetical protein